MKMKMDLGKMFNNPNWVYPLGNDRISHQTGKVYFKKTSSNMPAGWGYVASRVRNHIAYSFSHNHGSVENGGIFERQLLLEMPPIFHWTNEYGRKDKQPQLSIKYPTDRQYWYYWYTGKMNILGPGCLSYYEWLIHADYQTMSIYIFKCILRLT